MERFYIRLYYLKILHYLFFSFAVLSMSLAVILSGIYVFSSNSMIFLSLVYVSSSLYVARMFMKHYKENIDLKKELSEMTIKYFLISVYIIGMVIVLMNAFPFAVDVVYSFIYVNYYLFFVLLIGFLLGRFKVISMLFEVYSDVVLRRGKSIALEYSRIEEVHKYEIGSDIVIDKILEEIWSNREYPLDYVRDLEKQILRAKMEQIDESIAAFSAKNMTGLVDQLEKERKKTEDKYKKVLEKKD